MMRINTNGVVCNWCKQGLVSLYTHDFHYCFCGGTFVDGGQTYLQFGYHPWAGVPKLFNAKAHYKQAKEQQELRKAAKCL